MRLCGNARVAAVASRQVAAAQRFIDECSAQVPQVEPPLALGSYTDLLERDDIDAVYIPLPTALRHEWVVRAAQAGKHVIGEKPAALNAEQVADMLKVCQQHNVQYMDGVMFMHSQRLPLVRRLLDGETSREPSAERSAIGQLRRMASHFSFTGNDEFQASNIRTHSELEPYGCLGDLGWYCVRFFLWAMHGQMPVEVRARCLTELRGQHSPAGVPGEFSAELIFPGGVSANFYCSFVTENQQWVHLSGSRGYLRIEDFVLPYHGCEVAVHLGQDAFAIDNCAFHMEHHGARHAVREMDAGHQTAQEVRMFQHFSELVLSGQREAAWPKWTLDTQRVLDACFSSAERDGVAVKLQ